MKPIVIFGASVLGGKALRDLKKSGLQPVCFVDNDIRKQKELFQGYKVISFNELRSKFLKATIIIAAERYFDEIYEQVAPYYNDIRIAIKDQPKSDNYIEHLNVVVTERCTLKCKHCSSLMPLYKHPKDCNTKLILASLDKLLDNVDFIGRIEVLGGEPFLVKDLDVIVKHLAKKYDKIVEIDIVTNGTVVPKDISYLKWPNVGVVVNHYGHRASDLINKLDVNKIQCRKNLHWAWANMGDFNKRNRSQNKLKNLFRRCSFNKCTELLHGVLYRCPRSSHGTNLFLIPDFPEDYLKVDDISEKTIKKFMNKEFLQACNYCDGNTRETRIIEAGE